MGWRAGRAFIAATAGATTLLALSWASAQQQPVAFPHSTHIEKAGLQCTDCHEGAAARDSAGLPSIRKCMACHQFIAKDSPEVARLAEYWERRHEVPWVRVYGFAKQAAVQFRHAPHARAGVACSKCHGQVEAMQTATLAVRHTMGTCIDCHRERNASDDCLACHF